MKRPLVIITVVVLAVVLVRGAELVLERSLDRYLPPLLSEQTGATTIISPIRADIFTLTAHAERFQMGDPANPALVAEDIWVTLDWTDLLRGEIRLVAGGGRDLTVNISIWPRKGGPLPPNYLFLERWLPKSLELQNGRYLLEDGSEWPIHTASWQRLKDDSARLSWQETHPTGNVEIEGNLASLDDLLALRLLQVDVTMNSDRESLPPTELAFRVEPGDGNAAYRMQIVGALAGMAGTMEAEGLESWAWPPQRSTTHFDDFYVSNAIELIALFAADGVENDPEQALMSDLPGLNLPLHEGSISIGELHIGSEKTHDNVINFNSSGRYLALTRIIMQGLYGGVDGSAAVVSTGDGWELALAANVRAREVDQGLMARYLDSHWYFREGNTRLHSRGTTWGELLDGLEGVFDVAGAHRGEVETPVALAAQLDGTTTQFALEQVRLQLGDSLVTGSVAFTGGRERTLAFAANSESLDARFLFDEPDVDPLPGIALPTVLTLFPGIEVTWDAKVTELRMPSFEIRDAALNIDRGPKRGRVLLAGRGMEDGGLDVQLDYQVQATDSTRVSMQINLHQADVDRLFGEEQGLLESRTTGAIVLTSEGSDVEEIFAAMRGDADLTVDFRNDSDWARESRPEERMGLKSQARLVLNNRRIVGAQFDNVDIDSIEQDVSGTVSLVYGRAPFFIAELRSDRLNINRLLEWIPKSAEAADEKDILVALRTLGAAQLTVRIGELIWLKEPAKNVVVELYSDENKFSLSQLDYSYLGARVTSHADFTWQDDIATLNAAGSVDALVLNEFLEAHAGGEQARLDEPMTGSFSLDSQGRSFTEIVGAARGEIKLGAAPPSTREIDIDISQVDQGVEGTINALRWAGSDLRGRVVYLVTEPHDLDVHVDGGVLDLRPWEEEYLAAVKARAAAEEQGTLSQAAEDTGQFARDILSYPARLLSDREETPPGERIFSSEPMDLEPYQSINLRVHGSLDALHSAVAEAADIQFDVNLRGGLLEVDASAAAVNGGSGQVRGSFDTRALPPRLDVEGQVRNLYAEPEQSTYPRDVHLFATAAGTSEAELAGSLDGMAYVEFGRGEIDYRGLRFLTADAATSMFRALIPTVDRERKPQLRCAVTLADFTDGKGVTPYGWAARTRTANLLGAMEVDLKKERIKLEFRSRSREGVGISVANAFSNSVEIEGPLSDPRIVPNTPGLIVRGWAAFLTAGLSVLGESMFNRVLAGGNPCRDITVEIRKDLCSSEMPLASSPIACPTEPTNSTPEES